VTTAEDLQQVEVLLLDKPQTLGEIVAQYRETHAVTSPWLSEWARGVLAALCNFNRASVINADPEPKWVRVTRPQSL